MTTADAIRLGRDVIRTEIEGLQGLYDNLDDNFGAAVAAIAAIRGKVVISGVGKSGIIAKKIAATMASIGTPAMFMHPVDALHGDLGVIMDDDIMIVLSNSGNTKEICDLLEVLAKGAVKIIAITGQVDSCLGRKADITLNCAVEREACPMGLAPTTSTTAQLALGDALAVALAVVKGFDDKAFREYHPAGALGQQLMHPISEMLITGKDIPVVGPAAGLAEILKEMSSKSLGFTLVGALPQVSGIITDGDLRRLMQRDLDNLAAKTAKDILTANPSMISADSRAIDALDLMEHKQITSLLVGSSFDAVEGVIHLHDLLGRGRLGLK